MITRFVLPHLNISNRVSTRRYQAPQEHKGGGSSPRIREEHGIRLQTELAAAFRAGDGLRARDERLEPPTGVYIEVELRGGKPEILERKNDGILPGAAQLQSDCTKVALFVPDEARPVLKSILEDYTSGPLTDVGREPRRKNIVEPIETFRQARLESFWTDDMNSLPTDPHDVIWWEVWCFKNMADRVLGAVERLGARASSQGDRLIFPETTIVPVLANRVTIELMLFATVGISELRRASATPTCFIEDGRENQLEWAENLAARTTWPGNEVPAVCLHT